MKFKDWLNLEIDLKDILYQCSMDIVDKKKMEITRFWFNSRTYWSLWKNKS